MAARDLGADELNMAVGGVFNQDFRNAAEEELLADSGRSGFDDQHGVEVARSRPGIERFAADGSDRLLAFIAVDRPIDTCFGLRKSGTTDTFPLDHKISPNKLIGPLL